MVIVLCDKVDIYFVCFSALIGEYVSDDDQNVSDPYPGIYNYYLQPAFLSICTSISLSCDIIFCVITDNRFVEGLHGP